VIKNKFSYNKCIGLIFLLISSISSLPLFSQNNKKFFKENFLYGEYYLEKRQYTDALPFYVSVYKVDSTNANVNYRIGQCYANIPEKKQMAVSYLKEATKNIDPKYVPGKYKRPQAPPEAWLLLGNVYQYKGKLDSAMLAYKEYKKIVKGDKKKVKIADRDMKSIEFAKKMSQHQLHLQEFNLGDLVNTRFSDYNPVVSGDQTILVYTSFWESYDMIFMSKFENGAWSKPRSINKELDAEGDFYTAAISYKGNELILVKEGNYNSDLYFSNYRSGHWTKARPMPGKINSSSQETSASLSKDGKTLYFSSNRPGGEGGMDLYSATKKGREWNNVENLGKVINTEFDEEAPCILPDNITLYFSSNGHETMGGMDIFYSVLDKGGNWSDPVNIGPPVNTTGDDLFLDLLDDGKTAYISKYSPNGYGRNDIYKIKIREEELAPLTYKNDSSERNNKQPNEKKDTLTVTLPDTTKIASGEKQQPAEISEVSSKSTVEPGQTAITNARTEPEGTVKRPTTKPFNPETGVRSAKEEKKNAGISGSHGARFTIQIMALKNFIETSNFSNLKKVKVSSGDDGFYRYTVGEYSNFRQALRQLDSIRSQGYKDAFVREISSISNY
jgi:hypothetical protein